MAKHKKIKNAKASPKLTSYDAEAVNLMNGLMSVVQGLGYNVPPGGEAISQTDTLFKNNRWYFISNFRQLLSEIYAEYALIQNFIDVPVDDAFAHGYNITSKQLSADQIEELKLYCDRYGYNRTFAQALKWVRLFGGGGVLIITGQKADTELSIEELMKSKRIEFRAVDLWELFYAKQNIEDTRTQLGDPTIEFFDYYGQKVHRSRVIVMKGIEPPSFIRPRLRGWGLSVLEKVVRSVNQYLKSNNLVFEVLDEFKLDVYKIKNLVQSLSSASGSQKITERIQLANMIKNFQNALVMDAEDSFDSKSLSFAGVPEMMKEFRIQIASDLRIPMTKLFGLPASGLADDESSLEVYNSMVQGEIQNKSKYDLLRGLELCSAVLFGMVPDDLDLSWPSLRVLTDEQTENVKTSRFNRLSQAADKGWVDGEQVTDAVNKDELLPVAIKTFEIEEQEKEAEEEIESGEK